MAAPWKLSGGEVIGKIIQVVLMRYWRLANYSNGGNYMWCKILCKPWCLHSDWTITYSANDTWRIRWQWSYKTTVETPFVWTTSWVIAQEWDILIVDITVQPCWRIWGEWNYVLYLWFWYDWSIDTFHWYDPLSASSSTAIPSEPYSNMWPRPIQVSID